MLQLGVNMVAETRNGYLFGVYVGRDGQGRLLIRNAVDKTYAFDRGRCVTVNHGRSDREAVALFVSRTYRFNHFGSFIRCTHPYDRSRSYQIRLLSGEWSCTCKGYEFSKTGDCKHIIAVRDFLAGTIQPPHDPTARVVLPASDDDLSDLMQD